MKCKKFNIIFSRVQDKLLFFRFDHLVFCYVQVLALNGTPVKNLKHLATMVEECNEAFLKFDLDYDQVSSVQTEAQLPLFLHTSSFFLFNAYYEFMIWQLVVLETKTAKAATQDILTTHCIPSAMSEDLKS